jgi:cysteine-rich repeat protein
LSSDPALLNVSPATLNFNSSNWNVAQAITATAAHDANGTDENLNVTASGGGLESASLSITVYDDDICGDGAITGGEQCDDANTVATDGCHACRTSTGFYCNGAPSTCITVCGDGLKYGSEQCDDSNTRSGDGCSPSCAIEP